MIQQRIGGRLKDLRKRAGLKQPAIAEAMDVSVAQVSRWENGHDGIPTARLDDLAAAYRGVVSEIFGEDTGVPVVGYVGAGGEVVFTDDHEPGGRHYDVPRLPDITGELIGLEVRGDSMLPAFRDGYVAYIRREHAGIEEDALRDLSVCRLTDGRTMLKTVRRAATEGRFDLLSLNADPIEGVELEWATPVRGWLTRAGR